MKSLESVEILQEHISTLKECSKNADGAKPYYMTQSSLSVINFDAVKIEYTLKKRGDKTYEGTIRSVDALVQKDSLIILIEFKSGTVNKSDVRMKLDESLIILLDILDEKVSFAQKNVEYILVFDKSKNFLKQQSLQFIKDQVTDLAKEHNTYFGLACLNRLCVKKVQTVSMEEFNERIVPKLS